MDAHLLGLPRRQARLLLELASWPSLTRRNYQLLAGIGEVTASRDLAELLAAGHVVRLGSARATRYCLPAKLHRIAEESA